MAKALFFVLALVLFVAVFADLDDEVTGEDIEFLKRDPVMQELLLAEKRGNRMRKFKVCYQYGQECWCKRRTGAIVFCYGAGKGNI